jgi:D-alanine--poly(phosphoribitol) ligase subunit 1
MGSPTSASSSAGANAHHSLNLAGGVWRHAATQPEAPALVVEGRTWSYSRLRDEAWRVAERVLTLPPRPGRLAPRVGILASRTVETYAGILGVAAAGGTYVPINPRQPPARLASILGRASLDALVVDAQGAGLLGHEALRGMLPPCVIGPRGEAERRDEADAATAVAAWSAGSLRGEQSLPTPSTPAQVPAGHPAYVIFTSGTTGVPKGVVVSAGAVRHFLDAVRERYAIGPADRVGQLAETSFDLSVFELFAAWDGGATLCVVPESQLMAPAGFIRRERLTVWASVPSVITMLSRMKLLEPGAFPTLRASFLIGEALPVLSARAWQAAAPASLVDNQYGPTEAACACTVQRICEPVVETPERGTVAIGTPYAGMHAGIVREGVFVADGEAGELALHGPQLADGYLDDEELTAQRFPTLDHPQLGRGRWYLTGDLALRDQRGALHWLGRTDHQVKIMGHRVELEDIEAHLRAASGSDAVAAVVVDVTGGSAVAAFVSGAVRSPAEIRERMRGLVPPYMLPRRIVELDALPLSANGKVDRAALRALLEGEPA